eukprot:TRINITY_DN39_c0_g1_i1.p1 TRINITY_DN39_c0_g1~~TRINITY_DN39_c0_g1_i1.p1  ORF type:complete len:321 (+),score=50.64 TRINITY_DN39_c0_g1_i1:56-1018(+)
MLNGKYLLIAIILLIAQINLIKCEEVIRTVANERGVVDEVIALEIYFKGPCSRVNEVLRTVRISSHQSSETCLPITLSPGNPDKDDLNADVRCTDIGYGGHISLVRIFEVYAGSDDTVRIPTGEYIFSIASEVPWKVKGNATYMARPQCFINHGVCRNVSIVSRCNERILRENEDFDRDGYVDNQVVERVYILQEGHNIQSCNTSTTCCPYVSTASTGICGVQSLVNGHLNDYVDFSNSIPYTEHHHFHDDNNHHGNHHNDNNNNNNYGNDINHHNDHQFFNHHNDHHLDIPSNHVNHHNQPAHNNQAHHNENDSDFEDY